MNKYTIEITPETITETLIYNGKTYIKRWKRFGYGITMDGESKAWEEETDLPDELVEALDSMSLDELEVMDAL